jgi:hypothetical protein
LVTGFGKICRIFKIMFYRIQNNGYGGHAKTSFAFCFGGLTNEALELST